MKRIVVSSCTVLILVAGVGLAADKAAKNQMVKGTIKVVDLAKNVLIVNQKVKKDVVERELDIRDTTKFVIMTGKDKKEAVGAEGLKLLEGKEGASVNVKCDKDVNVLQVTVKLKK
jgi:hypothetical protein